MSDDRDKAMNKSEEEIQAECEDFISMFRELLQVLCDIRDAIREKDTKCSHEFGRQVLYED